MSQHIVLLRRFGHAATASCTPSSLALSESLQRVCGTPWRARRVIPMSFNFTKQQFPLWVLPPRLSFHSPRSLQTALKQVRGNALGILMKDVMVVSAHEPVWVPDPQVQTVLVRQAGSLKPHHCEDILRDTLHLWVHIDAPMDVALADIQIAGKASKRAMHVHVVNGGGTVSNAPVRIGHPNVWKWK